MATMSAAELDDWLLYYAEEPWGATRDNIHAGMIASQVVNAANAFTGGRGRRKTVSFQDFLLLGQNELEARRRRGNQALLTGLRAIAVKRPRSN